MEKLKQMTSEISSFWNSASWSDKGMMIIFCGVLLYLTIRYGLMKIKSSWFKVNIGSPWRLFGKIVSLAALGGICYGIYLFVNYCIPPKAERLTKSALQEQMERKLAEGPEKRLAEINDEAKKRPLTLAEENELVEKNKEAENIRKEYSTKLTPPPPKPAPKTEAKTKSVWVARLSADRKQIEEAMRMMVSQAANDKIEIGGALIKTDVEIRFSYKKRGKRHEAILTRENAELEYYYGIIDLSDNTQLELWLK